jgi:hypothetical protein
MPQERDWIQTGMFGWPPFVNVVIRLDLIEGKPVWVDVVCTDRSSRELLAQWAWPITPDTAVSAVNDAIRRRVDDAVRHAGETFP